MSVDRNRATARRFFEDGWNRRDFWLQQVGVIPERSYGGGEAAQR
jgi:hypothetical protein